MEDSFPQVVKLSDVCRVCLMQLSSMKFLSNETEEIATLIVMLESVVNFEFQKNDVLPAYICLGCEVKLKSAYEFQQLCLKSHDTIKTIILSNADGITDLNESLKEEFLELNPGDITLEDDPAETLLNISGSILEGCESGTKQLEFSSNLEQGSETIKLDYANVLQKDSELDSYNNVTTNKDVECIYSNDNPNNLDVHSPVLKEEELLPSHNPSILADMPTKKPKTVAKTKPRQTCRLEQFPIEKVNEAIQNVNKKFLENHECLKCSFIGSNGRALGLHISYVHKDVKDRWCPQCNLEYDDLASHLKGHTLADIVCQFCNKSFHTKGHLIEHLRCHSVYRPYPCETCGKAFISARHLRVHMRIHGEKYAFRCSPCNKSFNVRSGLKHHLKTHHEVVCDVENCSFYTTHVSELSIKCPLHNMHKTGNVHVVAENSHENQSEDAHEDNDEIRRRCSPIMVQNFCTVCDRNVRSLAEHNGKYHNNSENVVDLDKDSNLCNICGKMFKSATRLRAHSRIHTGETPYKCNYCDKKMLTRNHLVAHERTHTGEKPHICKFCGKGFAQSSVLNTHVRLHTGRPIECAVCGQRFCRKGELQLHLRKHTGEKPYLCTECGRGFAQRSHLKDHAKTHSEERPFQCQYCDRAFRQNSSLKSHVTIHLGHKPFKCPECPYVCRQSYSLTQHMWTHGVDVRKTQKRHTCVICAREFATPSQLNAHRVNIHNIVVT